MVRTRKRRRLGALVAAVALPLAACGSDETLTDATQIDADADGDGGAAGGFALEEGAFAGSGGLARLAAAAENTTAAPTYSMVLAMTMDGVPGVGEMSIDATAVIDEANEQMQMDLAVLGIDMEFVVVGDDTYVRSAAFADLPGVDAEWLRYDTDVLDDSEGGVFGTSGADATAMLHLFEQADGEIDEVGIEEIRGVEAMHLRVGLDLELMAEAESPEARESLEESLADVGIDDLSGVIPTEVWVDADGYLRKFTMTFDFGELGAADPFAQEVVMVVDAELYDFGEPIEIVAPDGADVQEGPPGLLDG